MDRYLRRQRGLKREALGQLLEIPFVVLEDPKLTEEDRVEDGLSLNQQRLQAVLSALEKSGAQRVLDLGCGEGRLLDLLLQKPQFNDIVGVDVSHHILERTAKRLRLDQMSAAQKQRIRLFQGSLVYRDARFEAFDAAAIVEVVEHIDPSRLPTFERVVFEFARPATVIVTTPNADYNVRWASLPAGVFRHEDHRFEWTRAAFQTWASKIAERFGYTVTYVPIGAVDPEVGSPTQMGVFTLESN